MDDWPIPCETNIENLPDLASQSKEVDTLANRIDISRFGKIRMLLNTTARILNLYKRYKNQNDAMRKRKTGDLTVSDLEDAEKFWILEAQSVIRSFFYRKKENYLDYAQGTETVLSSSAVGLSTGCKQHGTNKNSSYCHTTVDYLT